MKPQTNGIGRVEKINLAIAVLTIFLIGSLTGYLLGHLRARQNAFPEIHPIPDINPGVAMVQLREAKNGYLNGQVGDNPVRLIFSPEDILELKEKESFSIPISRINLNNFFVQNTIPEDALYIASKTGKYYYSVFDKKAFSITPKNRLFFKTGKEAERAGYRSAP